MRKLWIAVAILSVLATVAFVALFIREHYVPAEKAIANGVRVEVNLKTGEVKQAPDKPIPAPTEVKTEKPADKEAEKKEEAKTEEHKDAAKEEHKEAKDEKKTEEKDKTHADKEADKKEDAKDEHKTDKDEHKEVKEEPKEKAKEVVAEKAKADEKQKPIAEAPKGPRIGIVVAGLGLSRSSTEQILKLPAPISFSFSPYASDLSQWLKKAAEHEVYVDIPLEPKDYPQSDPGPYALLLNLESDKNLERLNQVLKTGEGYKGLVSGPEEHFTESTRAYEWLLDAMKAKKMTFYFTARPENKLLMQELEKSKRTEAIGIDLVLDEKLTNEAIDAQLAQAETLAQKYGYATILARPYPISAQRIQEWIKTLGPKNIHLVPLSQAKAQ